MAEWTNDFQGISIACQDKLVQIKTDDKLMEYLKKPEIGSLVLASYIRKEYINQKGKELQISEKSLAIEILIHCYIDEISHNMEKCAAVLPKGLHNGFLHLLKSIEDRTEVIDSGEASVDPNRKVFDLITPFYEALCIVLGKRA